MTAAIGRSEARRLCMAEGRSRLLGNAARVAAILEGETGKRIWRVSEDDTYRLMKIQVWAERHSVSPDYIVGAVAAALSKMAAKWRTRSGGIGFSLAQLTGDFAEKILAARIIEDFPDGENFSARREELRTVCAKALSAGKRIAKAKSPMECETLSRHVAEYAAQVEKEREGYERCEAVARSMPYRSNPWR